MQAIREAIHVAPCEGRAIWVAGDLLTFKLSGRDTGGTFAVAEDVTPPGGGPPPHVHHHEDELFFLLEGEYEILLGERTVRAGAGSVVFAPRGVPHTFRNVGTEPARMFALVTPSGVERFFDEVGTEAPDRSAPPPFGADDVAQLLAAAPAYGIEMLLPATD